MPEKRPFLLNVENGVEYVASTTGYDPRLAPVSRAFLLRVKSGEIPLAEVARIHRRGGDPEEVLGSVPPPGTEQPGPTDQPADAPPAPPPRRRLNRAPAPVEQEPQQ